MSVPMKLYLPGYQASLTFARPSASLAPAVMGLPPSPEPHVMAEAVPLRGLPVVVLVLLVNSLAQVWARGMPSARACPLPPMEALCMGALRGFTCALGTFVDICDARDPPEPAQSQDASWCSASWRMRGPYAQAVSTEACILCSCLS